MRVLEVTSAFMVAAFLCAPASDALGQPCEFWHPANLHNQAVGIGGTVFAATVWTPPAPGSVPWLIVGGDFETAGGETVHNIAAWDGASWRSLAGGLNDRVFALTVYNGELIAGGEFQGADMHCVARFDGSIWRPLGSGLQIANNGALICRALTVFNGELIATGAFWSAGGVSARNIARWNGSSWGPLAGGLSMISPQDTAIGLCLTVHNGLLFAGGQFEVAGATIASHIAQWDGASWSALGAGTDASVNDMISFNGGLAVGGYFAHAGGLPFSRVARWNGFSWEGYGPGLSNPCRALYIYFGQLVSGSSGTETLRAFNGETWNEVGGGVWQAGGGQLVTAMTIYNGELIAAGRFDVAGPSSIMVNNVARWDGTFWNPNWVPPPVVTAFANMGSRLIVAGAFTQSTTNGVPANNIMAWDGARKQPLQSGVNAVSGFKGELNSVRALKSYTTGFGGFTTQHVAVGGYFTAAGGISANRIAVWNEPTLAAPNWSTLGSGFNAGVFAIERYNGATYAAGEFTFSGGTSVNRIARWTGSSWAPLGSGLNGTAYALNVHNGYLYVGGEFSTAGGLSSGGLAYWDGATWATPVAGAFIGTVYALEQYNNELIIGGLFPGIPGSPNIARMGSSFMTLGTGGTDGIVLALRSHGGNVYVGGLFTAAGGMSASRLARWNISDGWSNVRGGADSSVLALGSHQIEVQAGGVFDNVENGTIPAKAWARYVESEIPWIVQHPQPQSVECHNYAYLDVVLPWGYPLFKQWMKDGEPVVNGWQPHGSYIFGANSSTLNFDNVHAFDAGSYTCFIQSDCGQIESFSATLTVDNCCIADIAPTPTNGQVDIADLLSIISAWGPCPEPPATCVHDIAPFGGDSLVNVLDLFEVIMAWGSCS